VAAADKASTNPDDRHGRNRSVAPILGTHFMSAAIPPLFRLYLLRHAKAAWANPGQGDFDRVLDEAGFAEAEIVAEMAEDRGLVPDLVLCSTAVRCRQTADALSRAMGESLNIRYIDSLYTGTADVYRDIIASQGDVASLMVVGHNPVIEEILRESLGDVANDVIPIGFPPGGLAAIDFEGRPFEARGNLVAWLDPQVRVE
jgi:phosphohistidine phosphatase